MDGIGYENTKDWKTSELAKGIKKHQRKRRGESLMSSLLFILTTAPTPHGFSEIVGRKW